METIAINKVYKTLKEHVKQYNLPVAELIEAQTKDPFKVLVGAMLSARTKDKTTHLASERLFSRASKPEDFEKLSLKEIEQLIYPVGFYKNKAKFLKQLPRVLKERFNGEIPGTVDELIKLPGVGRKTANLVASVAFKKPAICVDTHVHRIMNRLGYVKTKTPLETEQALRKKLPRDLWTTINYILVAFGQNLCKPVSPQCSRCPIEQYCAGVRVSKPK